jgi:hypothetical protein
VKEKMPEKYAFAMEQRYNFPAYRINWKETYDKLVEEYT